MTITIDLPPEVADTLTLRTPGLHAGRYWIADDFDASLPESFWLGADNESRSATEEEPTFGTSSVAERLPL